MCIVVLAIVTQLHTDTKDLLCIIYLINNMKQKVQFSFSTDFQAEVLKYLLRDPEGGLALKRLKPNYFVLIEHSIIAEGIFS